MAGRMEQNKAVMLIVLFVIMDKRRQRDGREKGSAENGCFSAEFIQSRREGALSGDYETWT